MYSLTKEQKLANVEESIRLKEQKVRNLQREIENLQKKKRKLSSSEEKQEPLKDTTTETRDSGYLDIAKNLS